MFDFIYEFYKNPFSIGAIKESSIYLAHEMVNSVDLCKCDNIVEYGPGTGVFTKEIIERKKDSAKFIIIEQNKEFYKKLVQIYGHIRNVYIINDSAENVKQYMNQYKMETIDVVFSGLPFTSLPKDVTNNILTETRRCLSDKGRFISFQYSLLKKNVFSEYFNILGYKKVLLNLPPAYVLTMCKN